ncbi:MAG: hypothetical protein BGO27_04070 [Alphaproteobacteria bacterium 33-17]|nr:MAG: hypothetical protein BGO27_04070 [Alphaproteobacteria bacterium 33-17]
MPVLAQMELGMARVKKNIVKIAAYTLVELSISMTIIAVMLSIGLGTIGKQNLDDKYALTLKRIKYVEKAIYDFYSINGYIPCPAVAPRLETAANFGVSQTYDTATKECVGSLTANTGMIPVRTLGIPDEYVYDGWNRVMAYRIARGFGSSADFNDTTNLGDIKIVDLSGYEVTNMGGDSTNNFGAAYVIVGYGGNGDTYTWARNSLNIPSPATTTIEYENANHALNKIYIQSIRTSNFDDVVAFKTKMAFLDIKKGLSPVAFPKQTCSNAKTLSSLSVAPTTALLDQIKVSAQSLYKLCVSPPQLCGFRPTDFSTLRIWWDGNDPAGTGTQPANNSAVALVVNKALPGTHNMVQGSGVLQPQFRNDVLQIPNSGTLGGIHFDADNKVLTANISTAINNGPYTLFFAGKLRYNSSVLTTTGCATNNTLNLWYGNAANTIYSNAGNTNFKNLLTLGHGSYDNAIYIEQSDIIDIPVIIMARYCTNCNTAADILKHGFKMLFINKNGLVLSNEGFSNLANNAPTYSANSMSCAGNTAAAMELKRDSAVSTNGGFLGEFLLYREALSDSQASQVIEYLSNRWFTGACR